MTKREMKRWKKSKKNYKLPWEEYTVFSYVNETLILTHATKNDLIEEYHNVFINIAEIVLSDQLKEQINFPCLKPIITEPQIAKDFDTVLSAGNDVICYTSDFGFIYIGPIWLYDALQKEAS